MMSELPAPQPSDSADLPLQLQQNVSGDRNQAIGQVYGGIVLYVSGGRAIINPAPSQPPQTETQTQPAAIGPNPYKGLLAFHESDSAFYFGRSREIQALWDKFRALHEPDSAIRLLPIYGPSGSGKSSLARAGLIPELGNHPLPGRDRARVAVLMPGTQPLQALAAILARIAENDLTPVKKTREFAEELALPNKEGQYDGLQRIASVLPETATFPLIVLVDQFEEVYSLCKDAQERDAFIDNLLHATGDHSRYVSVILTMRSDFLGETQKHPTLNRLFSTQGFLVPTMDEVTLREAISKPAELAGYPLDQATVDLLIEQTEGREGALPLLQFALTRIWEGLRQGVAPAVTLEQIGGVGGALAGEAQRVYDSLSPEEQAIARRVFLGLVQLGEGTRDTRRRAAVENLVSHHDDLAQVQQVLDRFTDPGTRLITCSASSDRIEAEVTHEALFDHWQALNDWLDQSRDNLRFQRQLEESAQHWDQNGRPDGNLWRSPDLDLLIQYHQLRGEDLTPLQLTFFGASKQAEASRKRLRRLGIAGLIVGIVLTTGLSVIAVAQLQRAERRRVEQLATTAKLLIETQPLEASLNAIAADGLSRSLVVRFPQYLPSSSVQESLLDASQRGRENNSLSHQDVVYNANFSPNGQLILTASRDKTAKLWDLQGNLVTTLSGHTNLVWNANFSPDGQSIITYSRDQTAKLWDLQGNLITTLSHQDTVTDASFSSDGEFVLTASRDKTAKLWDVQGNFITTFSGHQDVVTSARFSFDGQSIITASQDKTAKLWDAQGNLIITLFHQDVIWNARFSPDSQFILTASWDKTVKLWDLQGNSITTFSGHQDAVWDARFSSDGQFILSHSRDKTAKLWDLKGNLITTLSGHQDVVNSASFSPDAQHILTTSADQTAKLWDLKGNLINTLSGHQDVINSASFSPDSESILTASRDRTAKLWDFQENLTTIFLGHQNEIYNARFSPNSQSILTASGDQTAKLWDLQGNLITTLSGHQDAIYSTSFSSDSQFILTASGDSIAKLWDSQGDLVTTLSGHQKAIYNTSFSPNGQFVLTASWDGTAKLWDLQGNLITTLFGHKNAITSASFSPNSQLVLTASGDQTAKLWDLQGNLIVNISGHQDTVTKVSFSPDGQFILTASRDHKAKLWDLEGNLITTFFNHQDAIHNIGFSPNGRFILTAAWDGKAKLWDIQGNLITTLSGHQGVISDASFSPDGQFVITSSWDGTAKLWDFQGHLIATLFGHKDRINSVSFSPNGQSILTASRDGTARLWKVWEISRDDLLKKLCDRLRYHPVLTQQSDLSREARQTCERYVWQ